MLWGLFRGIGGLCFRLRLTGQENIPAQGRLLIAANHASILDIPFLGCGVARQLAFIGRHNLFPIPVINSMLQSLGWIPIRQDRFDRDGLRRAEACIVSGKAVVIFPEGARTETGALGEGKLGLAMLVAKTKCLVVPAYISGTFEALPIDARRISFHPVRVIYGAPIDFSREVERFSRKEFYRHVTDTVMTSIRDLALTNLPPVVVPAAM
jgi:1-acyl-sn-glycerol-3-phosphate acyltransferase